MLTTWADFCTASHGVPRGVSPFNLAVQRHGVPFGVNRVGMLHCTGTGFVPPRFLARLNVIVDSAHQETDVIY